MAKQISEFKENYSYHKRLTKDEVASLKHELSENAIQQRRLNAELKLAREIHKEAIKPLKAAYEANLDLIKSGVKEVEELCSKIINSETRMVEYINDAGEVVGTRPARPEEFQVSMFAKTGTK